MFVSTGRSFDFEEAFDPRLVEPLINGDELCALVLLNLVPRGWILICPLDWWERRRGSGWVSLRWREGGAYLWDPVRSAWQTRCRRQSRC